MVAKVHHNYACQATSDPSDTNNDSIQATQEKRPVSRPRLPKVPGISDTRENVDRSILRRPPNKDWRYLKTKVHNFGYLGEVI